MKRTGVVLLALLVASAHAWDANAHKMIGVIAYRHLTPAARAWCDGILATNQRGYTDFLNAAPYPDYLKHGSPNKDVRISHKYDGWHFIDFPIVAGQTATRPRDRSVEGNGDNAFYGIRQSLQSMTTGLASTRGFYLAMLIHLVGDLHQPLHCCERDGDKGGNAVPIHGPGGARNLHALWDDAVTLRFHLKSKKGHTDARIQQAASAVERDCSLSNPSLARDARDLDMRHWADESYALAVTCAYDGIVAGSKPSAAYLRRLSDVSERRVALAAYRLATLLNLLAPKS